ncbi:RagB/SusD family nutrient uptake outer membrane protein [Persicobacter sp. CCB-QB2]|uniref:RagB/SusD family nutrient uptake outer membrane protein n=1 Tax=Persicobacter sp. CCB-QB2 TaxID=1561025 RepID=UPI0009E3F098|nr:RagB/SusD family nutrient uptake outer membrane protein [Persicobacter sp. CCB-QB2]
MMTFKTINIKSLAILFLIGCMPSCSFLDLDPVREYERKDFYATADQAMMGLVGVYGNLRPLYRRNLSVNLSLGTDEIVLNKASDNTLGALIARHTFNRYTPEVNDIWTDSYRGISFANDFIYNMEGRGEIDGLSELQRKTYLGEGLALRALFYFNLVRLYEHVPLRLEPFTDYALTPEQLHMPNSPAAKVYDQIIDDLDAAIALLPESPRNHGAVGKLAAHGLLARVYLTLAGARLQGGNVGEMKCYEMAVFHCNQVISSGKHELLPSYRTVFLNQIQQRNIDKEILWDVVFKVEDIRNMGGMLGQWLGPKIPNVSPSLPAADSRGSVTPWLIDLFDAELDSRFDWNIAAYNISYDDEFKTYKYNNIGDQNNFAIGKWRRAGLDLEMPDEDHVVFYEEGFLDRNSTSFDYPLVRYSDVLLMKAEALNQWKGINPEAIQALDEVRFRAGLVSITEGLAERGLALSPATFLEEIKDERARELCFEGHRRFDLVRWGEFTRRIQETYQYSQEVHGESRLHFIVPGENVLPKHEVFPIPEDEINLNRNIEQHPDWQ